MRTGVAIVGIAAAVAVFVSTRRRETPSAPPAVPRTDPRAVVESTGAFVREVKGAKEHFRLKAERQLTYPDGTTRLIGVEVSIDDEGKMFVVRGREAEVGENQSHVNLKGGVELVASDGLSVKAESASYSQPEGIVRGPGPVSFTRGRMTGTGVGFTFDRNRDVLTLEDQASITFAPEESGGEAMDITSGVARLTSVEKYFTFERSVHIVQGPRVIDADGAVANLTEDESRITVLELRGNSRVVTGDSEPGGLTAMSARDMNLLYSEDGKHVQHAVLSGSATTRIAGDHAAPERQLSAESLEMGLAPNGATLTSLSGRDRVALDLPAAKGQTSRTIRATSLAGSGDAAHGLTTTTFTENVEYRETGGTPPVQRVVLARTLTAVLGDGFGEIRDARFAGGVRFTDGSTEATAANIRYLVTSGQIELTGNIGNTRPRVSGDEIRVDGNRIDMTLEGPTLQATGDVHTLMQPARPGPAGKDTKGATERKVPGLMQPGLIVNGTSDALDYMGGEGSRAVFTGNARLWQVDTAIQGEIVTLDGRTGNLTASGGVQSKLLLEQINGATKAPENVSAVALGREMQYDDAARKATYSGDARVNGPEGDVRAATIEMFLAPEGRQLERLEASEAVSLRQGARTVTGDRMSYFAADQRYVMSGKLVRMTAENCQETLGRILTFFRSTDRILVDGNEVARTQTTSADCPGSRPE